jgi:hypothetical protein
LGGIDQKERTGFANDGPDRLDWLHGSEHIGSVGHRDQFGVRGEGGADRFGIDVTGLGGDARQPDHARLFERSQRAAD